MCCDGAKYVISFRYAGNKKEIRNRHFAKVLIYYPNIPNNEKDFLNAIMCTISRINY
jgi:hypothetical protein